MRIIREKELLAMTGLKQTTRWRMERKGEFPARVQLGPNCVGWIESEVQEWCETRPRKRAL